MDQLDDAQALEERDRQAAIEAARRHQPHTAAEPGWCETCGEPIPLERLAAVPHATRCIGCQETFEERAR